MNSKEYFFDRAIAEVAAQNTGGQIRVLELGCGTASYVPTLIEKYPTLEYFGIEPIKESYDQALHNLSNVAQTKVFYQLGYDKIEGLEDSSFDLVISFSVLEHVKQLERFLGLSARYVKKDGLMVHRYDLGHALYPGSLKERLHVWMGNTIPSVLPETKFVRYVPLKEVEDLYTKHGVSVQKHTYHQMPSHKRLANVLKKHEDAVMESVYAWEFQNAPIFSKVPLEKREKLFPTVAVWGRKTA